MTISRLDIFYFQTEYFWLKSGRTSVFCHSQSRTFEMEWNSPFSNGIFLAEKWLNADRWSVQARTFGIEWIFRSNFKYNIAD
jgi:hypothetical protein